MGRNKKRAARQVTAPKGGANEQIICTVKILSVILLHNFSYLVTNRYVKQLQMCPKHGTIIAEI
jgi:hypothetical protein